MSLLYLSAKGDKYFSLIKSPFGIHIIILPHKCGGKTNHKGGFFLRIRLQIGSKVFVKGIRGRSAKLPENIIIIILGYGILHICQVFGSVLT